MEGEDAKDSFGSLIKLCELTASQEEKLRNCPFARESETFPDSDPDPISLTSSSESWTSSEHNVIIMVSPPDSECSIDGNTPQEEDKYHTPPEHSLSFASDSDEPKQPPPPPGTTACGGDDDRTVAVDLGEEEGGNLGLQLDRKLEGFDGSLRGKQSPSPPPPLPENAACGGGDDEKVERAVHLVDGEENLGLQLDGKLERFDENLRGKQPQPPLLPPPATTVCGGDVDQRVETAVHLGDEEENLGLQLDPKLEGFDGNVRGKQPPSLPPLPPPVTIVCGGDDDQTMERAFDFGNEEENRGFSGSQSNRNSREECCDCVIRDHEIEVLACELDRDRVLEGEFCENVEKKNRVCEGNLGLGIDTVCGDETQRVENLDSEIIYVDSEECDGELGCDKQRVVINVDSEKELKEGDRVSKAVNLLENVEDHGGGSKVENLVGVGKEGDGDGEGENLCEKSENLRENGLTGGDVRRNENPWIDDKGGPWDGKGENLGENGEGGGETCEGRNLCETGLTGGDVIRDENLCNDGEGGGWDGKGEKLGENGEGGDGYSKGAKLRETGEGGGGTSEGGNLSENGRGSDGISRGKRLRRNDDEGGELRKDNLSKSGNGDGVVCEAENLVGSRERAMRKALEAIEKFKYVGSGDGMEHRGKKRGVLGKPELTLSMTGQRKDARKEVEGGNKGMKGGSFMDFLDSLKLVIREEDDGSEHDFLETAKGRGMVFPRPRWWPPEGVD